VRRSCARMPPSAFFSMRLGRYVSRCLVAHAQASETDAHRLQAAFCSPPWPLVIDFSEGAKVHHLLRPQLEAAGIAPRPLQRRGEGMKHALAIIERAFQQQVSAHWDLRQHAPTRTPLCDMLPSPLACIASHTVEYLPHLIRTLPNTKYFHVIASVDRIFTG
jgi:hypothetical protein